MQSPEPRVLVAGAGQMAEEHVRALLAAGVPAADVLVAGRGRERAEALATSYGVRAIWGGAEAIAACPPIAVVAVDEQSLSQVAGALIRLGGRHLLIEKPGAMSEHDLDRLRSEAAHANATVFVGYNRRFYPSVQRAAALIEQDGGPLAAHFEFTEIEALVLRDADRRGLAPETLARWGLANSLHVIDLVFFLIGPPGRLVCERAGSLEWHPSGSVFAGAGRSVRGTLFSYWATWNGAGRWGVEVSTSGRKLVLRPLETVQQQLRGSFALETVELDDNAGELKVGLPEQLEAFLAAAAGRAADPRLCTLDEAFDRLVLAGRMLGYE